MLGWVKRCLLTRRTISRLAVAALATCFLLVCFPGFPEAVCCDLDPSWKLGLSLAHARNLHFGSDIVFTYGPLAYLDFPEAPLVSAAGFVVWTFATYCALIGFLAVTLRQCQSAAEALTVLIVLTVAQSLRIAYGSFEELQLLFSLVCLSLLTRFPAYPPVQMLVCGFIAGISLLIKLNDGIINLALFYSLLFFAFWQRLRVDKQKAGSHRQFGVRDALFAVTPPLSFLAVYVATGSRLEQIASYFRTSLAIASGYSEAMSLAGRPWQLGLAVAAILSLFVLLARTRDPNKALRFALTLIAAWAVWKHCMVRQDAHAVPFHAELALASLFGLIGVSDLIRRQQFVWFALINVVLAVLICQRKDSDAFGKMIQALTAHRVPTEVVRYAHLESSWSALAVSTDKAFHEKATDPGVAPMVAGRSLDDLAVHVDSVYANQGLWSPRPVFQGYAAYTPLLNRLNAAHLENKGAEFLTFRLEGLDGRHQFLADTLTWRQVFDKYDLIHGERDVLLLHRRRKGRLSADIPVGKRQMYQLGENIDLPTVADNQLLMMKADMELSSAGKLCNAVFRVNPVYLEATYQSRAKARFRLIRPNLADGAIVSDLPRSLAETYRLFGFLQAVHYDPVVRIRFLPDSAWQLKSGIAIQWVKTTILESSSGMVPASLGR